jgi:hypothetical protein
LAVRAERQAKTNRAARAEGVQHDVALAAPPVDGQAKDELPRGAVRSRRSDSIAMCLRRTGANGSEAAPLLPRTPLFAPRSRAVAPRAR